MNTDLVVYSPQDIQLMAKQVAASKLMTGADTEQAAFTLMMLCQSEGIHPIQAIRRFHIIKGRPTMRADAMQAEFQRQGGRILWERSDATACVARFIHQTHAPDPGVAITWTIEQAKAAGLTANDTWRKYPDAMLRARVISTGIRMVMPGIVVGIYTPEEVADFDEPKRPAVPASASVRPATRGGTTRPPVEVEAEAIDVTPKSDAEIPTQAEEVEAWSVVLDREVKAINNDFRNELVISGADDTSADFMNKWRAINGVVGELVDKGVILFGDIAKRAGAQDQDKAAAALEDLYRRKPAKTLATLRAYLQDRFHGAMIAAGLEEDPAAPRLPAMAADAADDISATEGGRSG